MKRTVLILSLLILIPSYMAAQQKEEPRYKHEWRFGVSGIPMIDALMHGNFGHHEHYIPICDIDYAYKDYDGERRMLGLLSAEYSFNRSNKFTFAIGGYLTTVWNKVYDYSGRKAGLNMNVSLHIIPTARFKYYTRPAFSAYGSIGIGAMVGLEQDGSFYGFPTVQFIPIGITFGRKIYGFAEYGGGFTYLGGSAGIGYRF